MFLEVSLLLLNPPGSFNFGIVHPATRTGLRHFCELLSKLHYHVMIHSDRPY